MAGVIGTGSIPRLLQDGVGQVFGNSLAEHETKYDKMFKVLSSTKNFEINVQLEGFSQIRR